MNSLVSYESSSDEEELETPRLGQVAAPVSGDHPTVNGGSPQSQAESNVKTTDDDSKPMIGPTIPHAISEQEDRGEPDLQLPDDLSEQDLVRFLTQATHPMTELPPSPPGSPNPQIEAKFKRFLELKSKGLHFNEDLAKKTTFRNPAVLTTLMDRAGISGDAQYATSLPKNVWDSESLPPFAYKEELLKNQQAIRDQEAARKKQASAAGKRTIDFTSASRSGASSRTSTPG